MTTNNLLSTRLSRTQAGFSLIELLVVATIMIVLTTIGLVSYQRAGVNARNAKRQTDLETIRQALVLYRTEEGTYPSGDFDTMMDDISTYISSMEISDPKDVTPYIYTYQASGTGFELCTYKEPDPGTEYCVTNP